MAARELRAELPILRLFGWSLGYAFRQWWLPVGLIVCTVSRIGLDLLRPWPLAFLVDYILRAKPLPKPLAGIVAFLPGEHTPGAMINWTIAATVLLFLSGWLLGLANTYLQTVFGHRVTHELAVDVFAKLQQLSLDFHARNSVADSIRRISADCSCVATICQGVLISNCSSLIAVVATFVILWRIDSTLAVISLSVIPYMILLLIRFERPLKDRVREQHDQESRLYRLVEQTFATIPLVQAFCLEKLNDRRFDETSRALLKATFLRNRMNLGFNALLGCATAGVSTAILWIGGQAALAGQLGVGTILAFLQYLRSVYRPLEGIVRSGSTVNEAAIRASHVREILEADSKITDKSNAKRVHIKTGRVVFDNVTFGYDPGRPVLRNISFEVLPRQIVAIVGASGAGKTTLVSLLPRFFDPWSGRVVIDGHDVRDIQLNGLRDSIGLVLQEPFLFPISVAENIAYGNREAKPHDIEAAARLACAHEFICRLPAGYGTIVGEGGTTLSGGERQRISIARAFLKRPKILILDEPTSALDAETEQAVVKALTAEQGYTTFVIAHRLSTVQRADRIMVLANDTITESGTHEELLAAGGVYADFHEVQSDKQRAGRRLATL